ncbi:hypothetical protein E1212_10755 [Jiangella ureilytica]|uniref:Uncharacterized protein n=1 Tax=Jiangella ureilytica TaxID=2530374 RepID=A0A4R4RQ21_9ACTN|nr:hypothetical protein [Jiangella ureilytica]TDC51880.1 hypothetical protein E1212_10755 [Jiangella ureilytica]
MIPRSKNFRGLLGGWFSVETHIPGYIEACERVPAWLAEGKQEIIDFRDELAVHIRDSSYPALPSMTQWGTDEWLRDLWFDAFGPDTPPGDPYPVPAADWGTTRLTPYMLHAVDEDDEGSSEGAAAWLAQRDLTAQGVYGAFSHEMIRRPEPADYADHLRRATEAGLREDG